MSRTYGSKQNGAAMAQPKILLTRIDDRFIYGQDVGLWNEAVGSNLVLSSTMRLRQIRANGHP